MIYILIKKELQQVLRSGQFFIAGIIVLALTTIAILVSAQYYQSVVNQHQIAKTNEQNVWEQQNDKNPHTAAHFGTYVFKPKYPLSLIDQGVDKFVGISFFLEAHKRNEAQYMAAADQTGLARFGELTPDFVLIYIIPLLVILLAHNSFTKEKERGTLSLIKSQGFNFYSFALSKWLGVFIPITIFTVAIFLIAGFLLSSIQNFGVFSWSSLLLMLFIYLVYYVIFICISLIVSSVAKNSDVALVALLVFWIISNLAIPKAATNIAELKYPYPTKQAFDQAIALDKAMGLDGHDPWSIVAKKVEQETLQAYNVSSLEELPFNYDAYRIQKGEEFEADIFFKHYQNLRKIHQAHINVYNSFIFISPYLPLRFLSMSLAHTDYNAHWNFSDAAEKHRLQFQKILNNNFAENSKYGNWAYKSDKSLWAKMPAFSYTPISLKEILAQNQKNITALLGWLILSFTGLFFFTKRL